MLKILLPTVGSLPLSFPSLVTQPELFVISPSSELDEPKKRKKESKMRRLIFLPVVDLSTVVWTSSENILSLSSSHGHSVNWRCERYSVLIYPAQTVQCTVVKPGGSGGHSDFLMISNLYLLMHLLPVVSNIYVEECQIFHIWIWSQYCWCNMTWHYGIHYMIITYSSQSILTFTMVKDSR